MLQLLMPLKILADVTTVCIDGSSNCDTGLPNVAAGTPELQTILQIVFGILSAVAVLIIVIAGFRFVTSNGNPDGAAKARTTMIYALVGLVIALSAEVFVGYVLGNV